MADLKTLQDLLSHEVQNLYSGEKLILMGLPRMIEKAQNKELKEAFSKHLKETEVQIERLEKVAAQLGISPEGDGNPSMKGLIAEGEKVMHKDATPEVMDASLICGAQKIEHYEISGYGTATYLAEELGFTEIADMLRTTLEEEQKTDTLLNVIAKNNVNVKAMPGKGIL
ncbi:YciE/YciF ferroxidase family protein [Rufibacter roseus]|uniref:Ferritin-like domain-containing protein n=1 Tax=Rufibacter roseus TaxID=1567108 RepID=A0ABW2DUW7_9BACT|nr:ferritin-like domain-containing protein [Rufibacter roseus]